MGLSYTSIPPAKRLPYLDLLCLGDENKMVVESYYQQGELYLIALGQQVIGVCLWLKASKEVELKNIGLLPGYRHQGFGSQVLNYFKATFKQQGFNQLVVGTGDGSLQQLAFYLKAGFRISGIKANFFETYDPPIVENGITLKDMVMLTLTLKNND